MQKRIEVERKFVFNDDTVRRIKEAGGSHLSESEIKDVYYDTSDFLLMLSDHWLRKRNGVWELKYPCAKNCLDNSSDQSPPTSTYTEVDDEKEILTIITELLLDDVDDVDITLNDFIGEEVLVPFCEMVTKRDTFRLCEETVIVLDKVENLNHTIGEIEVVTKNGDISRAVAMINDWGKNLDLDIVGQEESKVIRYLSLYRPSIYQLLKDKDFI